MVTAPSANPTRLRRQALEWVCRAVSADAGLFYKLYQSEGAPYLGDAMVAGPGAADVPLANVLGAPAPTGSAGSSSAGARWRRGRWDTRTPLRLQRNHFVALDTDIDRDVFMRMPVWPRFYAPGGLDDHIRALVYDGDVFVGWIGVFRQGRGARFRKADRRVLERGIKDVRALLTSADQIDAESSVEVATYAVLDAGGRCEHATRAAREYLDRDRLARLREMIRGLDAGSIGASPYVFWGGVQVRVVRLDADGGVRYLAVIDRAVVPRLSPMCRLTDRQRTVAEYAASGATNEEIARALETSVNTVKYHLKKAYEALGVASRAELGELWARGAG